jgi:hypothetical protein
VVGAVPAAGHQWRRLVDAARPGLGAPRVEPAAGRGVDRRRHIAGQDDPLPAVGEVGIGDRYGRQQRGHIGVPRPPVELAGRGHLGEPAQIHHRDPVADLPHHRQVVGDEQVGEVELPLQVGQQVEDLRPDGDVQGGDRLVTDDQLGPQRQRPGHADALALAAGELGRVAVVVLGVEPDQLHQLLHPASARRSGADPIDGQRVADDRADPPVGVERPVGVLEDHLELAPVGPQLPAGKVGDVMPVEDHPAGGERVQAGGAARQRGLAAAGLPHQAESLPPVDLQADPVDGMDGVGVPAGEDPAADREVLDHAVQAEQHLLPRPAGTLRHAAQLPLSQRLVTSKFSENGE